MATEKKKSPGLTILGKSSNWYEKKTRRQLLAKERDHSPFFERQVDDLIIPTLEQQGRKLLDEPEALTLTGRLQNAKQSQGYTAQLEAAGGYGNYQFAVTGGALPVGLGMDNKGRFFGVPALFGSYSFTVTATDSLGQTVSAGFSLVVDKAEELPEETVLVNPGARFDDPIEPMPEETVETAQATDTANATEVNGATETGQGEAVSQSSEANTGAPVKAIVEPSGASDSTPLTSQGVDLAAPVSEDAKVTGSLPGGKTKKNG